VVLVTYQRCGSSFVGQLFNSNRRAFYMFEPLDALYSAMYATKPGYNVPSDITTHWNGSERSVSAVYSANVLFCSLAVLH